MNDNDTIRPSDIRECENIELRENNRKLKEEIAFYQKENECLKAEIADLKSADSKIIAEPIKAAENLIYANKNVEYGLFGTKLYEETERAYSKSELRQIAEHLLVYCNSAEERT